MKAWRPIAIAALAFAAAGPLFAPRLLAFPYSEQIGADRIWATAPAGGGAAFHILLPLAGEK